ncbi:MAG TPA: hypothetical protein VMT50_04485, partial [Steroidobacteraceae bacterium]|nr:hypothetical protein [Steroidobacteraceae bacterium]
MRILASLAVLLMALIAATPASHAAEPKPPAANKADAAAKTDEKPIPEAKVWVTKHQIRLGGTTLAYVATAGTVLIKNDKDEPIALFGFTAYTKDG